MPRRKSPKICSKLLLLQGTCCASAAVVSFLSLIVLALLLLGPSHVLFYAGGGFKVGVIVRSSGHDGDGNASLSSIRAASEDIAKSVRGLDALQLKPPDLVIQEIRYFFKNRSRFFLYFEEHFPFPALAGPSLRKLPRMPSILHTRTGLGPSFSDQD